MTLRDLFGPGQPPVPVAALALDDREVAPGTVFFCVPGFTRDGHDFAPKAVAAGASALVVQRPLDGLGDVPQVLVPDVRAAMAPAAAALAGDPTRTLRTAGITGTNGKTTTSYLLRGILEGAGHPSGMLGTVESVVGGTRTPTVRTTPEALELQRTFRAMLDAGDTHCAMEVSSHAMALRRADAIHWAVVGFTNLSQDHLDFHADMEEYFQAKRSLFVAAGDAPKVVVADDAHGRRLLEDFPDAVGYGLEAGEHRASDLAADPGGTSFTLDGTRFSSPLHGAFNVHNALVAIGCARALGLTDAEIAPALEAAEGPPGRLQPVEEGQPFRVFVDYAHTPDGLTSVLGGLRDVRAAGGRVIAVLGAGGDRDRSKRPHMGAAAAEHADVTVLTSDNPRSEDPEAILDEVAAGAPGATRIADRRDAIHHAVGLARAGDVVVIAGKGHEQGQELAGGVKVPFDDVAVAREAIRATGVTA